MKRVKTISLIGAATLACGSAAMVAAPAAGATAQRHSEQTVFGCHNAYDVARGTNPDFHPGGTAGFYIMLDGSSGHFLNWTLGVTSPRHRQPNGHLRATTFIGEVTSDAPFTFTSVDLEHQNGSDVIQQSSDGKTINFWFTNYSGLDSFTVSNNCAATFMTFHKLSINGPSNPAPADRVFVGANNRTPFVRPGHGTLFSFPRMF
jgi:hypothetical protein